MWWYDEEGELVILRLKRRYDSRKRGNMIRI